MEPAERLRALVESHHAAVRRYAHHRAIVGADADDLVAEVSPSPGAASPTCRATTPCRGCSRWPATSVAARPARPAGTGRRWSPSPGPRPRRRPGPRRVSGRPGRRPVIAHGRRRPRPDRPRSARTSQRVVSLMPACSTSGRRSRPTHTPAAAWRRGGVNTTRGHRHGRGGHDTLAHSLSPTPAVGASLAAPTGGLPDGLAQRDGGELTVRQLRGAVTTRRRLRSSVVDHVTVSPETSAPSLAATGPPATVTETAA